MHAGETKIVKHLDLLNICDSRGTFRGSFLNDFSLLSFAMLTDFMILFDFNFNRFYVIFYIVN